MAKFLTNLQGTLDSGDIKIISSDRDGITLIIEKGGRPRKFGINQAKEIISKASGDPVFQENNTEQLAEVSKRLGTDLKFTEEKGVTEGEFEEGQRVREPIEKPTTQPTQPTTDTNEITLGGRTFKEGDVVPFTLWKQIPENRDKSFADWQQDKTFKAATVETPTTDDPILQAGNYTQAFNLFRKTNPDANVQDFQALYGTSEEWEARKRGEPTPEEKKTQEEEDRKTQEEALRAEETTPTSIPTDGRPNDGTANALQRIDDAVANGTLDENTATLFRQVVRNWDVNKELNFDNVRNEFNKIAETTISPFFAEQADIFEKDMLAAQRSLQQSRAEELEAQGIRTEQRVKGTQEELERRGLTFSSEAAEQLGGRSAFGEKVKFGGELGEGLVEKESRLIASGSQRAHQQAIDALGRQAETVLGQRGAGLVEGFTPRGVTQGTLAQKEQQARASALQGLAGQQRNLFNFQKPIDFNFNQQ
jgi:hypothetical protein